MLGLGNRGGCWLEFVVSHPCERKNRKDGALAFISSRIKIEITGTPGRLYALLAGFDRIRGVVEPEGLSGLLSVN